MKKQKILMWVDPSFKNVVKANASMEGVKVLDYTKKLSEQLTMNYEEKKKQKKNEYWFKF